jgi:hypothetical protein
MGIVRLKDVDYAKLESMVAKIYQETLTADQAATAVEQLVNWDYERIRFLVAGLKRLADRKLRMSRSSNLLDAHTAIPCKLQPYMVRAAAQPMCMWFADKQIRGFFQLTSTEQVNRQRNQTLVETMIDGLVQAAWNEYIGDKRGDRIMGDDPEDAVRPIIYAGYESFPSKVRSVRIAVKEALRAGLTQLDLHECGIEAFPGYEQLPSDYRHAALAVMDAGEYKKAREIILDGIKLGQR